jgi:hypothetical protein
VSAMSAVVKILKHLAAYTVIVSCMYSSTNHWFSDHAIAEAAVVLLLAVLVEYLIF